MLKRFSIDGCITYNYIIALNISTHSFRNPVGPTQLGEQDCSYVKQVRFTEYRLPLDILNIGNLIFKPHDLLKHPSHVMSGSQNQALNALTERM
ncbi:hypothetical protein GGP66_002384 [Salinibacter ruber]|uniref:Uncharacterized protein n=1 Tax=Salinibacter ruber TaxID=146919 RepID=A0A9X2ZYT0_9BACT|nr:hypothetical protein [Salinibacter ruber]MCS3615327.1 hypothetical protein [Salinibacter ruber]MCS3646527.1 hypothetical protein [Salinibacter ruber]MCS3674942.1 hypothetical protein [Salinibacter ruber]MCS3784265.1 hypothetical protein [Salinibacter ruber]